MRITHYLLVALLCATTSSLFSQSTIWTVIDESSLAARSQERWVVPEKYTTVDMDANALRMALDRVPQRFNPFNETKSIHLPMPDGSLEEFAIVESPIMHPDLAAKYPEIRTFSGQGITNPAAAVYLDWTPQGFHGMVMMPGKIFYIDPYFKEDNSVYVAYDRDDYFTKEAMNFACGSEAMDGSNYVPSLEMEPLEMGSRAAVTLRSYDIAIAATGQYTIYHGGTKPLALAAINTTLNRVRGIYETELAVTFTLISNNDNIIYTDSLTDPYTPTTPYDVTEQATLLAENQTNIDAVIGSSNYDIGHLVGRGNGGVATVSSLCKTISKARGLTASSAPRTDAFDVDYVAHEIGHQLGAHHTFNGGPAGSCTAGNRFATMAYEPGSGSTIMAYAGLCSPQNMQRRSNAYFHLVSLGEIVTLITTDPTVLACTNNISTSNNTPIVNADPNGMDGKYIPISTPFELTASGSDPDGNTLTYAWEQLDLSSFQGAPSDTNTTAPVFRSFSPSSSPTRTFPSLSDILDNTTNVGEKLPSVSRNLNFGCTVRDNVSAGGGYSADAILLRVTNTSGPFSITSHNTSTSLNGSITVTWNVASTTSAPVSCANVDIMLSLDGGTTFTNLLANTPNDGSQVVTLPNTTSNVARIKVKCSDNVFFDINNADLRIVPSGSTCIERLTNAAMDAGTGWTQTSTKGLAPFIATNWPSFGGPAAHGGTGYAWLGYDNSETARLSQTITIPSGAHFAKLVFWYRYDRTDCGGDAFNIKVNGTIIKSYNFCNDPAAHDWTRQIIDLTAYIGTSPAIMFECLTNTLNPSDVFVDDASVFVCTGGSFAPLPVELSLFEAMADGNDALLKWETQSELNNRGFEVEMQSENTEFRSVGFVAGHGTSNVVNDYDFKVNDLKPGVYYFRLRQIDEDGSEHLSEVRSVVMKGKTHISVEPNPVNEVAQFKLVLEQESQVYLEILDATGRQVAVVADGIYAAGKFDLAKSLSHVPAGVYFYHLNTNGTNETGRLVLKN